MNVRLNKIETLKSLKNETNDFWRDLFVKTFTGDLVCVMGEPSIQAVEELAEKVNLMF